MSQKISQAQSEERCFIDSILRIIYAAFYLTTWRLSGYHKEKTDLELAVTYPASWLKDKRPELVVSFSAQKKILTTVIDTIKAKGNVKAIRRFSLYFLHTVQEHMKHQGDRYLDALKSPRAVSSLIPRGLRGLQQSAGAADPGATLAAVHKVLQSRRRIRKRKSDTFAGDLFDRCNATAGSRQKPEKVSHTIGKSADSGRSFSNLKSVADSSRRRDSSG